jgi:hypothetical protein
MIELHIDAIKTLEHGDGFFPASFRFDEMVFDFQQSTMHLRYKRETLATMKFPKVIPGVDTLYLQDLKCRWELDVR